MASIPENATANTFITKVEAVDIDTGVAGIVHYPRIHGLRNSSLLLNSVTGVISMASDNHGFDREEASGKLTHLYTRGDQLENSN